MTPWHEYLMDVYLTSKCLIAITCIPIGLVMAGINADLQNFKLTICGFILAFLGLAIPLLLPTQAILVKLLEW